MRVLIVQTYHYFRGGDATYGFSLANLLRKNGHQVNFLGMKHPLNLPCEDEKFFVDYIDFREANANKNIINGIKVLSRSIYSTHVREKFKEIIRDKKPDIIHIQNLHGHITPSILLEAKKQNIPVVMTLHDYKFICPNTHLLSHGEICESCEGEKFYNCLIKRCKKSSYSASFVAVLEAYSHKLIGIKNLVDIYISPSEFLKNKFIQYGWKENRIEVINNFLISERFNNSSKTNSNYVLYLGQLEPWKGVSTLLKAAMELPQINFKLLGNGSFKDELIKRKGDYALNNVEFEGFKTGEELNQIIQKASIVVVPSECYENYPYSIMEAMAFGKPVIASNIGGIPELVTNNRTGNLFEKGNFIELKYKISNLCNDKKRLLEYGQNAFEFASNNLNEDLFYSRIIKIYNNLLALNMGN